MLADMTSTSPIGTTRATCRCGRRFRLRRLRGTPGRIPRGARAGRAHPRGVPALRRRAGRGRGDGAGPQPGAAAQPHPDGRAGRHPHQSDQVNELANSKPIEWFEQNLIARVPLPLRRRPRRVYPGFVQLSAFMSDDPRAPPQTHPRSIGISATARSRRPRSTKDFTTSIRHPRLPRRILSGDGAAGVPGARLPAASSKWRGRRLSRARSGASALLTVEGETRRHLRGRPDAAAHDLCSGLRPHPQAPPRADGRRPLRRIHRQALGEPGLPAGEKRDSVERMIA